MRTLKTIAILCALLGMNSAFAAGVTSRNDMNLSNEKGKIECPHRVNVDRNAKTAYSASAQDAIQIRTGNARSTR